MNIINDSEIMLSLCAPLGHIPVIPLNYSTLSKQTLFSRDLVEMCFKEILLAMSRCLNARRNIQLDFNRVGRLLICDTKAKMKFFHDFIKKLDVSGELENAFRTHTTQSEMSIMTNPIPSRLSTASALTLPRYCYTLLCTLSYLLEQLYFYYKC